MERHRYRDTRSRQRRDQMCNSLKRVGLLALTLAALALPSVGIAGVQAASKAEMGWQGRSAAKLIALHFKHEDALYQPRRLASSRS
jgi:hypothetical protein